MRSPEYHHLNVICIGKTKCTSEKGLFQFKVLHRYLMTNKFLHKIGLVPSFLCTFCKRESESNEHFLIECDYSNKFWQDLINWFSTIDMKVEVLSEIDKIFGLWKRHADFHLLNHFLIPAKQHM